MAWEWELADLDGVTIGLLRPRSVQVQRVLNGACTMQVEVDAVPALSTAAVVRGWRAPAGGGARVLRATGKVKPISLMADGGSVERITLGATDGYGVLADRLTDTTTTFTAYAPRDIVVSLVASQNGRANTGVYMDQADTTPAGPVRDRTYDRGKNVAEAILQLAEVDDGYYFRVDPYDGYEEPAGWWYFSELILLHPDPGSDSTARFEFGAGTRANLAKIQVDVRPPINYVFAFGSGTGDAQLVSEASDADSIAAYGLMDASKSFSDVVEQATLDQHALDMLRPTERRTFKVEVASSTDNGELSTPSPWDDFDVGDTVWLTIRTSALEYTGRALVKGFTVTVDANGVERLSSLDFQEDA